MVTIEVASSTSIVHRWRQRKVASHRKIEWSQWSPHMHMHMYMCTCTCAAESTAVVDMPEEHNPPMVEAAVRLGTAPDQLTRTTVGASTWTCGLPNVREPHTSRPGWGPRR